MEKAYWHPHNFEILSGQLRLPGLPEAAERQTLERKINSYGKTWHTWMSGMHDRQADALPLGPPRLQWSFNRDGEAIAAMIAARDARFGFNTADARADRRGLTARAKPQGGVDAIAGSFPHATAVPGVTDNGDPAPRAMPTFSLQGAPRALAKPSGQ